MNVGQVNRTYYYSWLYTFAGGKASGGRSERDNRSDGEEEMETDLAIRRWKAIRYSQIKVAHAQSQSHQIMQHMRNMYVSSDVNVYCYLRRKNSTPGYVQLKPDRKDQIRAHN